jgi:competence protein ComEA
VRFRSAFLREARINSRLRAPRISQTHRRDLQRVGSFLKPIAKEWHMTQSNSSVALRRAVQVLIAACLPVFAWAGPVDINKADAKTIAKELNGVGLSRAQAIVEFREKNGAFKSIEDLRKVKGIGAKTLEQNRSNIRLDATETKKAG